MKQLRIYIEINGVEHLVGTITGENSENASFEYDREYVYDVGRAISISLPVQKESFTPKETKTFFDGLLPEGFSRRAVSSAMRVDDNDYMSILSLLGNECLGAIRVVEEGAEVTEAAYVELTQEEIKAIASEGTSKSTELLIESHLSLAGASGKVGLYYDSLKDKWYQPIGDAPSSHIVKQSHVRFENLVVNEQLCLLTARKLGISTPESFVINKGRNLEEDILFATKRYDRVQVSDRVVNGINVPKRFHQEDFAQALGIPAAFKYEHAGDNYLQLMFECIQKNSANPIPDKLELWRRIVFNTLIGNTDAHIKNFSLLYDEALKSIRLAPAYDIVSTRIYPSSKDLSFSINGKYKISNLERSDFIEASHAAGIGTKPAMEIYDSMQESFDKALGESCAELVKEGLAQAEELRERILRSE
ncbi:MAG: HipA domain-containing protein [Lachnospiraceae bacterium]|nr:HipA domain-containing protein [Lachnospiraceae bacterium]